MNNKVKKSERTTDEPTTCGQMLVKLLNKLGFKNSDKSRPRLLTILKGFSIVMIVVSVLYISVIGVIYLYFKSTMPAIEDYRIGKCLLVNTMDKEAKIKNEWATLKDIPKTLSNAFIAYEDKRFYENHLEVKTTLFNPLYLAELLLRGEARGCSTINNQVVLNMWDDDRHDRSDIFRQTWLAMKNEIVENSISKDDILEFYLNAVYLGSKDQYEIHGVKASAKVFFDKELKTLTLAECASLAALPQGPSSFSLLTEEGQKRNEQRRKTVLEFMFEQNLIDLDNYNHAINEQIQPIMD